jgi:diguanylate cyclase (GGDEF)-like protein
MPRPGLADVVGASGQPGALPFGQRRNGAAGRRWAIPGRVREFLHRLATPAALPGGPTLIAGLGTLLALFSVDVAIGSDIALHVLYVFPLTAIAFHVPGRRAPICTFVLTVALQCYTIFSYDILVVTQITDAIIAIASSTLTLFLSRSARENYLHTLHLASHDPLTGLHNRHSFEASANLELARQTRYGGIFSLVVIDLDEFKALNDSRGHHQGDEALKLLACVLQQQLRRTDLIARLGGDEFAVLLPNTGAPECESLCRQLTDRIGQRMRDAGFPVTASIGGASFGKPPESIAAALIAADAAMYRAKAAGGNSAVGT